MSRNEWESGEITLPRAAIVPIRRALVDRNNKIADDGLALAKRVWASATAAEKKNFMALNDKLDALGGRPRYDGWNRVPDRSPELERAAEILNVYYGGATPRPPQKQNAGHLGVTETSFRHGEATVSFDAKSGVMRWDVRDNNHAVSSAHAGWLGETLFAQLEQVKWTRGTGGWFTGNDEYNQDTDWVGGGGNYVTTAWGPIGLENHPYKTFPFTKSDGTRVTQNDIHRLAAEQEEKQAKAERKYQRELAKRRKEAAASGMQGRVGAGVSTGGQWTTRVNSAPFGSLR